MPPRLVPANRRTDADTEALRSLLSRCSLVHRINHTHPQIRRIWLGHGASQKTESAAKTPPFRGTWESRFNPNGNRSRSEVGEYGQACDLYTRLPRRCRLRLRCSESQ